MASSPTVITEADKLPTYEQTIALDGGARHAQRLHDASQFACIIPMQDASFAAEAGAQLAMYRRRRRRQKFLWSLSVVTMFLLFVFYFVGKFVDHHT